MDVAGAHVVLTGATGTLGRALAQRLSARGARLSLVARTAPDFPADLTVAGDRAGVIAAAEQQHGPIDVLINNAGVETAAHVVDEDAASLARTVELNLLAPIDLTRLVLSGMLARNRGTIVNISSMSAISTVPGMATYAATKAGLSQFTSGLRADLRGTDVRTLLVELGPITSPMMERARANPATDAAFARLLGSKLLSMTDVEDAGEAIARALERDRRHLRRPRRAIPYALLTQTPRELAALVLTGAGRMEEAR